MKKSIFIVLGILFTTAGFAHQQPVKKNSHCKRHHVQVASQCCYCQPRCAACEKPVVRDGRCGIAVYKPMCGIKRIGPCCRFSIYQPGWAVGRVWSDGRGGFYVYQAGYAVEYVRACDRGYIIY